MITFDVNYLAVLVAALAAMVLGALWYSPLLFGNQWIKLSGFTKKQIEAMKKKGMAKGYAVMFITTLITAFVLANLTTLLGAGSFVNGAVVGFWVWLGFLATSMLGSVLWEGKPLQLYFINVVYSLVNFLIMGGILGLWV